MASKWRTGIFLSLLILTGLACSFLSGISDQGQEILTTAQSLATEIDSGELLGTVEAMATEVNPGELIETVQAVATGFNPEEMLATAEYIGTQAAGEGGDALATAQAAATQVELSGGEPPEDIPLVEGDKADLFTSTFAVSYGTDLDFATVLQFYQDEMPANGWDENTDASVITEIVAVLIYNKVGRTATVTISSLPVVNQTQVQILIQ